MCLSQSVDGLASLVRIPKRNHDLRRRVVRNPQVASKHGDAGNFLAMEVLVVVEEPTTSVPASLSHCRASRPMPPTPNTTVAIAMSEPLEVEDNAATSAQRQLDCLTRSRYLPRIGEYCFQRIQISRQRLS
ncbi:hypothetical protein BH24CHL3_BH24CHL3_10010 [soil metagenome]